LVLGLSSAALLTWIAGCPPATPQADDPNTGQIAPPPAMVWSTPFDASGVGVLSAIWGSGPSDIFVVGGTAKGGEIYHFDGDEWAGMDIPDVPLLVWVFGFGPSDVYAVGVGGGALQYDGAKWRALDSGTSEDLWGVWGTSSTDLWIVGGTVGAGDPILMHYDGSRFTPSAIPSNDRDATSLFKVWGIGSKVFAVGENGLIIEYADAKWSQVPAGAAADDDLVALWGTSESNIVAVGGRSSARVSVYDGQGWRTQAFGATPGLNAVFMVSPDEALIGGLNGVAGVFKTATGELVLEDAKTADTVHAIWADNTGRAFAVGGSFAVPQFGMIRMRTGSDPGVTPIAPKPAPSAPEPEPEITDCNGNGVEDADDIGGGKSEDCNADGVPDECQDDSDHDGVTDDCDVCPVGNDAADADNDGVPDKCDACPDGNDNADADADGVPDDCDVCAGFDDNADADGDGVADGCDACPGSNDAIDSDGDGVPNGCDSCDGDLEDSDGDGIANACDICPGGNDAADADGDTVPDFCDNCPGGDDAADADGDGVCDALDQCPGSDDAVDLDRDGIPDDCDPTPPYFCGHAADCLLGEACDDGDGVCLPTSAPDIELGYYDYQPFYCDVREPKFDPNYVPMRHGDNLPFCPGFQGPTKTYVTIRVTNFPLPETRQVLVTRKIVSAADESPFVAEQTVTRTFEELAAPGSGEYELRDYQLLLGFAPGFSNGVLAEITVTLTDIADATKSVSMTQNVVVELR
jgi:hypothetical protein